MTLREILAQAGVAIPPFVLYVLYGRTPLPAELYLDNGTATALTYKVDGGAPREVGTNKWNQVPAAAGSHHIVAVAADGSVVFDRTKRKYTVRSQVYKGTNAEAGDPPGPAAVQPLDFVDVSGHRYVFQQFPQHVEVWTKSGANGRLVQTGMFIEPEK